MRKQIEVTNKRLAQIIVWVVFGTAFLAYLRRGSESVSLAPYYRIRRSVPSIWNAFYLGLPRSMSNILANVLYSVSLAIVIFGVLVLFWMALTPDENDSESPESEQSST